MYKTQGESRGVTTASKAHHQDVQHSSEGNSKKKIYLLQKRQQLEQQAGKMDKRRRSQHTDPQRGVASENLPSTETNIRTKAHRNKAAETGRLDPSEKKRKRNNTTILLIWRSHCTNCCCCNRGWRERYFLFPLTCFHQPITVHLRRKGNRKPWVERKCTVVYLFIKKRGLLVWELHVQISWCFDSTPCACTHTAPAGA